MNKELLLVSRALDIYITFLGSINFTTSEMVSQPIINKTVSRRNLQLLDIFQGLHLAEMTVF